MAKLAPSMLSADFSNLTSDLAKADLGGADLLHLDIMDGAFVPNITFGGPVVKSLVGKTKMPFDVHLMIEHPENRIPDFITAQTQYITVHQEACTHLHRVIQQIKDLGVKAGVAINPATPVCMIEPVLGDVDMVLVMSVNPGFGGQKFIPSTVDKVKALASYKKEHKLGFEIEIDGGVNLDNCKSLVEAGVDILVAGSAVFKASDVAATVEEFERLIK